MNENRYKEAMEQVTFDQGLDQKIMHYVMAHGEEGNKKFDGRRRNICTVAVVACLVCLVTGAAFAAAVHFRSITPIEHGLVAEDASRRRNVDRGISSTEESQEGMFSDTDEIRSLMAAESSNYQLLGKERGSSRTGWTEKFKWSRNSAAYYSEDGANWQKDESVGAEILDEYIYTNYEKAAEDGKLPDVMKKLASDVKLEGNVSYGEYSRILYGQKTEENSALNSKQLKAAFSYEGGRLLTDLSEDLTMKSGESSTIGVITGTDAAVNQRTYKAANGMTYQLSDNGEAGNRKTTTLVSAGSYHLILQFENLEDPAIHRLLDRLVLTGLEAEK